MLVGLTNRRTFSAALGGAAAWPLMARGQRPLPLIGYLSPGTALLYGSQVNRVILWDAQRAPEIGSQKSSLLTFVLIGNNMARKQSREPQSTSLAAAR